MPRKPFVWPVYPDHVRHDFDLPCNFTAIPSITALSSISASSSRPTHDSRLSHAIPEEGQHASTSSNALSRSGSTKFISTANYYKPDLMDRLLEGQPVVIPPVRQQRRQSAIIANLGTSSSSRPMNTHKRRASSLTSSTTADQKPRDPSRQNPQIAKLGRSASVSSSLGETSDRALHNDESRRRSKAHRSSKGWAYIVERPEDKDYLDSGLYYEPAIRAPQTDSSRSVRKARIRYTADQLDYRSIDVKEELNWAPRNYGWVLLEETRDFRLPFDIIRDHYPVERENHPERTSISIRELTPTPEPTPEPEEPEEEPEPEEPEVIEEIPEDPEVVRERFERSQKPERFGYLHKNIYVNRRAWKSESMMVCECVLPEDPEELGCGAECINRMMQYICDPKTCPCGERCSNVPLKRRQGIPEGKDGLVVIWTGDRGFGLKTFVDIARGQFIMEYRGEIISRDESYQRVLTTYKDAKSYYFLDYDGYDVIDAGRRGNASRFINHSCGPNVKVVRWKMAGYEEYEIGMYALCDIPAGSELTYDYGWQDFSAIKSTAATLAAEAQLSNSATLTELPSAPTAAESPDDSGSDLASSLLGPVASTSSHSTTDNVSSFASKDVATPDTIDSTVTPPMLVTASAPARQPCFCGAPQCSGILGGKKKVVTAGDRFSTSAPNSRGIGKDKDGKSKTKSRKKDKGKGKEKEEPKEEDEKDSDAVQQEKNAIPNVHSAAFNRTFVEKVIPEPPPGRNPRILLSAYEIAERDRRLARKMEIRQQNAEKEMLANGGVNSLLQNSGAESSTVGTPMDVDEDEDIELDSDAELESALGIRSRLSTSFPSKPRPSHSSKAQAREGSTTPSLAESYDSDSTPAAQTPDRDRSTSVNAGARLSSLLQSRPGMVGPAAYNPPPSSIGKDKKRSSGTVKHRMLEKQLKKDRLMVSQSARRTGQIDPGQMRSTSNSPIKVISTATIARSISPAQEKGFSLVFDKRPTEL